jgi:hypothetical protein
LQSFGDRRPVLASSFRREVKRQLMDEEVAFGLRTLMTLSAMGGEELGRPWIGQRRPRFGITLLGLSVRMGGELRGTLRAARDRGGDNH